MASIIDPEDDSLEVFSRVFYERVKGRPLEVSIKVLPDNTLEGKLTIKHPNPSPSEYIERSFQRDPSWEEQIEVPFKVDKYGSRSCRMRFFFRDYSPLEVHMGKEGIEYPEWIGSTHIEKDGRSYSFRTVQGGSESLWGVKDVPQVFYELKTLLLKRVNEYMDIVCGHPIRPISYVCDGISSVEVLWLSTMPLGPTNKESAQLGLSLKGTLQEDLSIRYEVSTWLKHKVMNSFLRFSDLDSNYSFPNLVVRNSLLEKYTLEEPLPTKETIHTLWDNLLVVHEREVETLSKRLALCYRDLICLKGDLHDGRDRYP